MDYAVEVCDAVIDVWQPTPDNKVIFNLPATVEVVNTQCLRRSNRMGLR